MDTPMNEACFSAERRRTHGSRLQPHYAEPVAGMLLRPSARHNGMPLAASTRLPDLEDDGTWALYDLYSHVPRRGPLGSLCSHQRRQPPLDPDDARPATLIPGLPPTCSSTNLRRRYSLLGHYPVIDMHLARSRPLGCVACLVPFIRSM